MTNYLADQESKGRIVHFDSEIFNIRVVDSQIDLIIGTCSVLVNETVSLNSNAKLPTVLKIRVGARVIVTNNLDISDRLISGKMGKVLYMDVKRDTPLIGRIFVKFEDPKAVNSRKDVRLRGELKEFVSVTAETKFLTDAETEKFVWKGNSIRWS